MRAPSRADLAGKDDRHAGRGQILLDPAVDEVVEGPIDRPRQIFARHVRHQGDSHFGHLDHSNPTDGFVGGDVQIPRHRDGLRSRRAGASGRRNRLCRPRRCRPRRGAGVLECSLAPRPRNHVPGLLVGREKVHRHHRELQRGAALDEEDVEVIRRLCHVPGQVKGPLVNRLILGRSMRHFDERHPGAAKVEELGLDLLEDLEREGAGAGAEIVGSHGPKP